MRLLVLWRYAFLGTELVPKKQRRNQMRCEILKHLLASDLRRINALIHQLSRRAPTLTQEQLEGFLQSPSFTLMVARTPKGTIVGMAGLSIFEDFPYRAAHVSVVSGVVVDRHFRGQGIGKKLMLQLHDIAKMNNLRYIWLRSDPDNPERAEARLLYQKLGYVERSGLFRLSLENEKR